MGISTTKYINCFLASRPGVFVFPGGQHQSQVAHRLHDLLSRVKNWEKVGVLTLVTLWLCQHSY